MSSSSAVRTRLESMTVQLGDRPKSRKIPMRMTVRLTGTAMLAALVMVFDYGLKLSGLRIPFPWLPFLKFDFTGVPITLSLLLYGLASGTTTSIVALVGIFARSGDVVGAAMKAIAEFATVLGMAVGLRFSGRWVKSLSMFIGIILRLVATTISNLLVLPVYYGMSNSVVIGLLPMIGAFNIVQGIISVFLGYLLYEGYVKRIRG